MQRLDTYPTVILGDLHGNRDVLVKALTDLGFIDESFRWCGSSRHLVQLGDVIDRGPEPLAALDLLRRLQAEAQQAGGRVTCLLGNHELFALRAGAGDHADRLSWAINGGDSVYREWCAREGIAPADSELPYPDEFYALFAPDGRYGSWLHTHELACQIGPYIAVHAGWPADGPASIDAANGVPFLELPRRAPLVWVRDQPDADVAAVCERLGVRGIVAGHTIVWGIRVSAAGRLIQIDAGMSRTGIWVAVGLDETGQLWALRDGAEPQPLDDDDFLPLPVTGQSPDVPLPTPRFAPGDRVRLYTARDGTWTRDVQIEAIVERGNWLYYAGQALTGADGRWQSEPLLWPVDLVDRFGAIRAAAERTG